MKHTHRLACALFGAAALALAGAARADMGCDHMSGGHERGAGMKQGMMDMGARVEARLAHLKGELKITPQQEALWSAYADKVKQGVGSGVRAMRDKAGEASISASERMERMTAAMKARLASMESISAAFKDLYASLSPEQKVAADNHMSHMGRMGHRDQRPAPAKPQG